MEDSLAMRERCAIFSCLGLGDGLITLVLSNNLHLNGKETRTFHPFLSGLQSWFPHLPIHPFPKVEELATYDRFFIFYERSERMHTILNYCQNHYPEKTIVLNPIATPKKDYPYWSGGCFDGSKPFVDNLYAYVRDICRFSVTTKSNGILVPKEVRRGEFPKRIILHPCSSKESKNWPREKYLKLAHELKARGYEPAFILTEKERKTWDPGPFESPFISSLGELAAYVAESGQMIGNDSGIGHLASCLGLPTLTICRSLQASRFWRPSWAPSKVVTPPVWIPNLKYLRIRDKHWGRWVLVKKVLSSIS